jgi:hypothetical protein
MSANQNLWLKEFHKLDVNKIRQFILFSQTMGKYKLPQKTCVDDVGILNQF